MAHRRHAASPRRLKDKHTTPAYENWAARSDKHFHSPSADKESQLFSLALREAHSRRQPGTRERSRWERGGQTHHVPLQPEDGRGFLFFHQKPPVCCSSNRSSPVKHFLFLHSELSSCFDSVAEMSLRNRAAEQTGPVGSSEVGDPPWASLWRLAESGV